MFLEQSEGFLHGIDASKSFLHWQNSLEALAASPQDRSFTQQANDTVRFEKSKIDFSTWLKDVPYFNLPLDRDDLSKPTKPEAFCKSRLSRFRGAWRTGLTVGMLTTFLVFLINLATFMWLCISTSEVQISSTIVYEGSCAKTKKVSAWCHLAINMFSTLLLGASNNGMQYLVSPTRAEIDLAHARGTWLDIGVPSLRNLKRVARQRVILWLCLCLSSIPLHLL